MQSKPESFQTSPLLLAKGQSHFEQLPRGTVIRIAAGSVALVQRTSLERLGVRRKEQRASAVLAP